ncbi:MAG: glycosyltransferase family 4 protein [Chloroflexota bacterium]
MKKQIAYIGIKGLPSKAGADRVVEGIVQGLNRDLYQPVVYCCARTVPSKTVIPGVDLVRIFTIPGKYFHAPLLFLFAALHALLFRRYDLIHVHNVEACFIVPFLRLRYKVLSTSHGAAQLRDKWSKWAKLAIQLTEYPFVHISNEITSVSKPLAEHYQEMTHRQVHYIPNGVNSVEKIDIAAAKAILEEIGLQEENYIFFAAGRIIGTKGCHFLLEAMQQIDTDVKVLVVGDASHMPEYKQHLEALADDRVHFVPFIADKATLMGLLRLCRFFVFPSTVEAMSMMLLEAAEVGAPVLCSDIAENTNVLPQQARFFHSADVDDLRRQILWALENPQKMEQLARDAKAHVDVEYRWDEIVRQYQALYARLTNQAVFLGDKIMQETINLPN